MIMQKLGLALFIFSIAIFSFADEVSQPCTREAIDEINKSSIKYINYFSEQNNIQAIEAIRKVQPPKSFLARYEAELKMLSDDANYQPSQALCNGVYNIKADMDRKLKAVAEEYKYPSDEDKNDHNIDQTK